MADKYRKLLADRARREAEEWGQDSGGFGRDWSLPTDRAPIAPRPKGHGALLFALLAMFMAMAVVGFSLVDKRVW